MIIGVPKETYPGERRVALVPSSMPPLIKSGLRVQIEAKAGLAAGFNGDAYADAGAEVIDDREQIIRSSDVLLQVRGLGANPHAGVADLQYMREGQVIIAPCDPLGNLEAVRQLAERGVTLFAMELIPRITRAQSMDVLSSMATIAGYKAVLLAADRLPKMFPLMMTAAGTLTPAKVFVIGAGVAGLQAIATSQRLGAVVHAYDVRPAVKEQVESLRRNVRRSPARNHRGRRHGRLRQAARRRVLSEATRADGPHRRGQRRVHHDGGDSRQAVAADHHGRRRRGMAPGSMIVDLAAERGGNCELTKADETVVKNGVTILGPTNLPSEVPTHASQMLAKNLTNFLKLVTRGSDFHLNLEDEIVRTTLATHRAK